MSEQDLQNPVRPLGDPEREDRPSILVVDDEAGHLDLICRILQPGYRVLTAATAEEGQSLIARETPHLILCDQRLPGMSGVQFLERAKSICPDAVRIIVTAFPEVDDVMDAVNRGEVRRYLAKTYTPPELRSLVAQELEHRELKLANRRLNEELAAKVRALESTNETLRVTVDALEAKGRALEQANRDLKSLDEMKDNFQANVSHELKTPLVAGMGYIELLVRQTLGPVSEQQRRCLEISYRNLSKLVRLIEDLLAFNQLRASKDNLFRTHFALPRLLRECIDEVHDRSTGREPLVDIDVPPTLPLVHADRDKVQRVFANLFSNAEKFAAGENVRIRIVVSPASRDRIQVSFEDNGIGIPEDKQEMVFDRFRQIDESPTRRYNGMGLGLALVREVLAAHDCTIRVASNPDAEGTAFVFDLPIAPPPTTPSARAEGGAPAHRQFRILVVDDEHHILDFVRMILSQGPYECFLASSGEEGLALLADQRVDLVLLDLAMEGMDGLEVCRRIKAQQKTRTIPVHMFSAMTDERAIRDARAAGCDGYITKPFKVDDFLARIGSIVGA